MFWTKEVTEAIEVNDIPGYFEKLLNQLTDLVTLVRGNLSAIARAVLSALIVIEVWRTATLIQAVLAVSII